MQKKTKSSLKKAPAKPTLSLPMWIGFWSLVLGTMVIIVASFTSAIQPLLNLPAYDASADIAELNEIKQELDAAVTALDRADQ